MKKCRTTTACSGAPNNKEETSAVESESATAPAAAALMLFVGIMVMIRLMMISNNNQYRYHRATVATTRLVERNAKPLLLLTAASAVGVATCTIVVLAHVLILRVHVKSNTVRLCDASPLVRGERKNI